MTLQSDAALQLAANGYSVFPCNPADKRPRTTNGFKDASTNPAQVAAWWSAMPDSLVGLPTGEASGLYVLDIDAKNGKNGFETLQKLGLGLPDTRVHWTPSGGAHLLFVQPPGLRSKTDAGVLGAGVDRRGEGGYIIFWPAHGGAVTGGNVLPPPAWMLADCRAPAPAAQTAPLPVGLSDDELRKMLRLLPSDEYGDYSKWLEVGAALHHETGGDIRGLALWDEISQVWPNYAGGDVLQGKWGTFGRYTGAPKTMRSLIPVDLSVFGKSASLDAAPQPIGSRGVAGHTLCFPEEQAKLFKGCAYVVAENRILTPSGELLDKPRFEGRFGGLSFSMDNDNAMTPSKSAWDAFVHSQALRHTKVDRMEFRPDMPPHTIYEEHGLTYVNIFRPVEVRRVKGDVALFLAHLAKLFPHERDRAIVLAYLAALVQYQGHKFNWALFIQGTHGNGKTLLSLCVKAAIGGIYCVSPTPHQLVAEHNGWLRGAIFANVEDVYVPTGAGKAELMEVLKPMITAEIQPIRAMRADVVMARVCCNFLLNSNHKDGVKKSEEDRRTAPIFCAQQRPGDMERDGMDAAYFSTLFDWLLGGDGYAMVSEYLHTYPIPAEFGLQYLKGNAPVTSSTAEAIERSLGPVDAEVLEAIAQCQPGFCGGWVSSISLDALLRDKRMDSMVTRTKRPEMMERLGYVHHPDLRGGRTTTPLKTGGQTVLYIKKGHINGNIKGGPAITRTYEAAQGGAGVTGVFGKEGAA